MALHDVDQLTCPRCGHLFEDQPEDADSGVEVSGDTDQIRLHFDCPTCEAPLAIVIESALPEAIGADVWVEDRHDPM